MNNENKPVPDTDDEQGIKSWVFISHSNRDYDRVAFVRNLLEKYHKRPIMFFLKCIEQDKELDSLLKREIDARDQFILCESENAQSSDWVQAEVDYIKSKRRVYQTVHLNDPDEWIEKIIRTFISRSRVFLTYSHSDERFAKEVETLLTERGFQTWANWKDLSPGASFTKILSEGLDKAAEEGYQLLLLSERFMSSKGCESEVSEFINKGARQWIIPVRIDDAPLTAEMERLLAGKRIGTVSPWKTDREKAFEVVEFLVDCDAAMSQ